VRAFIDWFWRAGEIADARSAGTARLTPFERECSSLAALAERAGEELLRPAFGAPAGFPRAALGLFREAAYWRLRALHPDRGPEPPATVFERDPTLYESDADDGSARTRQLLSGSFITDPTDVEDLGEALGRARDVARLLGQRESDRRRLERALFQRWTRTPVALAALGAAVVASVWAVSQKWPRAAEFARTGTFETSSAFPGYVQRGLMAMEHPRRPLFHTWEEDTPWVIVDLEKPRNVRRLEITNRRDCCQERAVPLIVELGTDKKTWTDAGRVTKDFDEIDLDVSQQRARYVRLSVPRKSLLHLDDVRVYSR
jgi:hypothetical protein